MAEKPIKSPSPNLRELALVALKKLTKEEPETEHFERYFEEARAEKNDRGAAILIATNLENALEWTIARHLGRGKLSDDLFGNGAPIATFDYKIRIGFAIGIFMAETRQNLEVIKAIRNAFAHAKIPVAFEDNTVKSACGFLVLPALLPPVARAADWRPETPEELDAIQGRQRYERVCNETAHNLWIWSLSSRLELERPAIKVKVDANRTFWAIRKPLP